MYYLLTETFKSQESKLVALIRKAAPVERIYMLGSTLLQRRTESIFTPTSPTCRSVGHYWLLVLVDNVGKCNSHLQDKMENSCRSLLPVTIIVLDISTFGNWLKQGHRFAQTVKEIAVLLYTSSDSPFQSVAYRRQDNNKEVNNLSHAQSIIIIQEFIAGAELYDKRSQYRMAAFMLHQAAEHALHAILKVGTGLHINTHNIDKLVRYCSMVADRVNDFFPRNSQVNKRLFHLLQEAYIATRYKESDGITSNDIKTLMDRINGLYQMAVSITTA